MNPDCTIERVLLRRVSASLGFAEIRLREVNLTGLKVEQMPGGRLKVTPPSRQDALGQARPIYALQPVAREAIEAEIATLWGRQ